MMSFAPRTLQQRLSLTLVTLILCITTGELFLFGKLNQWTTDQSFQALHADVARALALRLQENSLDAANSQATQKLVHEFRAANPALDVYFVNESGRIIGDLTALGRPVTENIDIAVVKKFLESSNPSNLPLRGTDPKRSGQTEIFSAYPASLFGETGYLYVLLRNQRLSFFSAIPFENSLGWVGVSLFFGLSAAGAFLGFVLFHLITKRFSRMAKDVKRFELGDFRSRLGDTASDEVGDLGRAINAMVDAIAERDRKRQELVANVTHDLRSPVTSITGYASLIAEGDDASKEVREGYNTAIQNSSSLLVTLLSELAELSTLESGSAKTVFDEIRVKSFFDEICLTFQHQCFERGVKFEVDTLEPELLMFADRYLLERVFRNLLGNALRYSSGGAVRLGAEKIGDRVTLSVSDTGPGIPDTAMKDLFERGFQAEHDPGVEKGASGLGLAICREIVTLHGGTLTAENLKEKGARFSFDVPSKKE